MTRADYGAIAFAFLLLIYLYAELWGNDSQGELVKIQIAGQDSITLPLDYNKRIELEGKLGHSIIEIKDRQVRFVDAPCKDKQCIISGWLSKDGEMAACLPNGISVQIVGRDNRFDAINF